MCVQGIASRAIDTNINFQNLEHGKGGAAGKGMAAMSGRQVSDYFPLSAHLHFCFSFFSFHTTPNRLIIGLLLNSRSPWCSEQGWSWVSSLCFAQCCLEAFWDDQIDIPVTLCGIVMLSIVINCTMDF